MSVQQEQPRAGSEEPAEPGGLYGSDISGHVSRAGVGELVGTFILVYAGCATAVGAALRQPIAGGPYDSLAVALAFGLVLVALVSALGHVSGCHLNPAVTIGLAATGKFPVRLTPVYIGAQLGGAVLGALAVWVTYGSRGRTEASLAATVPADGVGLGQALVVEALITFILVFVVISVATDPRVEAATAGLAVGFAVAAGVLLAGPVTGGSINPARSIGPAIVSGEFTALWVYILGPIVGGLAAAFLYDRFVGMAEAP